VAAAARPLERLYAELHEELTRTDNLADACSGVLDAAARAVGVGRAVLVARSDAGLRAAAVGLPDLDIQHALPTLGDADTLLVHLLQFGGEPAAYPAGSFPPVPFDAFVAMSFRGLHQQPPLGVLLIDAAEVDGSCRDAAAIMHRMGPALARVAQLESLNERVGRASRQRDLLTTIVNSLPDPVLLTDAGNDIALANRRAEQLFSALSDDNAGRRRAIQINNLLFSSFLTQTTIDVDRGPSRELNLVDTAEGSDLLFEVLSVPVPNVGGGPGTISVLRDITDLRHAVRELEVQFNRSRVAERDARRERDRLNVILENVSDPILVTDQKTNIVLLNPEADRLFVVDREQLEDRRTRRQIEANDARFTTLIHTFMLRPELRSVDRIRVVDPETGAEFPAEVASSKILNDRGEPVAVVSVLHDLTQAQDNERLAGELQQLNEQLEERIRRATEELAERNRQLEWQSQELQKASRLKSEFLANMSHELRTPINVILGYTSLLREEIYGSLTHEQDEALAKTYRTSQHLLELINDILDLSKIEAGKMPLHLEPVAVDELVAELSEALLPMLRERSLAYQVDVAEDLPVVRTDRTKLRQVLLNLLSNAVKFTHQGSVRIFVGRADDDTGIRIVVSDTGIGIRPEDLPAIFDDFRQIDQSHTREHGGTGLGLSITRKLLTLMGGSITAESEYGAGTTFTIDLPASIDAARSQAAAAGNLDATRPSVGCPARSARRTRQSSRRSPAPARHGECCG
jgi:PAS domain S-box-containing protein